MKITIALLLSGMFFTANSQEKTQQDIEEFYIDGLKVILKTVPRQVISTTFTIRGGTANYPKDLEGIEALTLKLVTEGGTTQFPKEKLNELTQSLGIKLDYTADYDYGILQMNSLKANWDESWPIFADIIANPAFDAKQFALIKKQVIAEAKFDAQDPDFKLLQLAMSNVFKGMDYEKVPSGTPKALSNLTLDKVKDYHKFYVNKNNCFLIVVGDINKEKLKAQVSQSLKHLPIGSRTVGKIENFQINSGSHQIHHNKTETNYLRGYMNAPRLETHDGITMQIAMKMLNERIFNTVRREAGLSYAPRAYYARGIINNPYNVLYVSTPKPAKAIQLMVRTLNDVRADGFTDEELKAQKATFITDHYLGQETTLSQCLGINLNELRESWNIDYLSSEKFASINLEDINRVIRKYSNVIQWTYYGNEALISYDDFSQPN